MVSVIASDNSLGYRYSTLIMEFLIGFKARENAQADKSDADAEAKAKAATETKPLTDKALANAKETQAEADICNLIEPIERNPHRNRETK